MKQHPPTKRLLMWGVRLLLLFSTITILPGDASASPDKPLPPQTLIAFVQLSEEFNPSNGNSNTNFIVNLTFPLSQDDPNQTSGSFDYNVSIYKPDVADSSKIQGSPDLNPGFSGVFAVTAIPNRPGWVFTTFQFATTDPTESGFYGFQVGAINTTADEGGPSCIVAVDSRAQFDRDQCGQFAQQNPGMAGLTVQRTAPGVLGSIILRWDESTNDVDAQWDYVLQAGCSRQDIITTITCLQVSGECEQNATGELNLTCRIIREFGADTFADQFSLSAPQVAADTRETLVVPGGLGLHTVALRLVPQDNLTRWRGVPGCVIGLDIGLRFHSSECGTTTNIAGNLTPFVEGAAPGGPTFPLVNMQVVADSFGVSTNTLGLIVGAIVFAGLTITGLAVSGPLLAAAFSATGMIASITLRLWPPWISVIMFMASLAIIIFLPRRQP